MRATDRGTPELYADVDVELDVVDRNNRPPVWETPAVGAPISPIYVKENSPQGHVVTTVRARFVDIHTKIFSAKYNTYLQQLELYLQHIALT